ncbi:hypothetical protein ACFQH2_10005 [Natronoarchaeum sp. GCM10025703]|uniref:DUF7289 family protein n=1 Tax=unclassified Natronoarchaeum TaxID=2620183 RepID=UPI00360F3C68
MNEDRGVAHVLGVILMAGFAITVAATVAVAGAAMFTESQSGIETAQVESSFSSLAADASDLEDGDSVEFDLGTADGNLEVKEGTGKLKIYHVGTDGTKNVYSDGDDPIPINSLVYTNENGDTVAYQGGGVFRQRGSGSSLVSAPDFYYRDNALSFPIQKVDGDISSSGTLSGELELEREDRHYPTDDVNKNNPLSGGTVYVELESEYCQGWEEYFSQQTRGSISEGCGDGTEGMVKVELSVPFELGPEAFDHETAIGATEYIDASADDDDELAETEGDHVSANTLIKNKASDRDDADYNELPDTVDDPGFYYIDDDLDSAHHFDTSDFEDDEEIEVYVDGNVIADGDGLTVEGADNRVIFYVGGNFDTTEDNNAVVGNDAEPKQTVIFVSSDGYVFSDGEGSKNPKTDVYAIVYAPDSDGYMQAGNEEFKGAVIADEMEFGSSVNSNNFDYHESITAGEGFSFVDEGSGPEFYYLHVTERTVTVSS